MDAREHLYARGPHQAHEHQRIRDIRTFCQYATEREFCEPVERLTGRKVRSFLSAIDTDADDLAMEAFILYPAGYDDPSRADDT